MVSKSILWIQSPHNDNKSILSYNGKQIYYTDKNYQYFFQKVASHDKYKKLGSKGNTSLFYNKTRDGLLSFIAYSNYKEKDVVGCKIAFMFRTDVQKGIDVKNLELLLEKASAKYGYHVSSNPYDILHELKKKE